MNSSLIQVAAFDSRFASLTPFLLYLIPTVLVFVETGLLFGFFLPGDSLLFSLGLVVANRNDTNIVMISLLVFLASFFGDQVGYVLGRTIGRPYLERRKSARVQTLIVRSELFYSRYGWWSVVTARFFPWIRTFVPPIAGTAKMNYYKFLSANALGGLLWGVGITLSGYYSASLPWVKNISYGLASFFIFGSIISMLFGYFRNKRD